MATFRPPQKINLSEWIEKEIVLPATVSPGAPGRVRLYEFQRGIADAIGDPLIRKVTVLKSARVGYTTLLLGTIAHFAVNDPSLILAYLPSEDMARSLVVSDLEPTFQESPALRGVLSGDRPTKVGTKDRSTMLMRQFTGGSLKALSGDTERSFRAHNTRVVILDEVDGFKPTKAGHPIKAALVRAGQVKDYKLITGSTPLDVETSYIIPQYEESDKRIFEARCVECDGFHEIAWKDIHWPEGRPEEAHWVCPGCGSVVEHKHKSTMVARGRWRVTKPEVVGHAGFKINALSSPIPSAHWGILAQEFLEAKSDPESLRTFINLKLGEGWRTEGERIDDMELMQGAEPFGLGQLDIEGAYPFPEDVLAVTVGIDMQDDRGEVTYLGHSETGQIFVLDHDVVYGRYEDESFWQDIDALISQRWKHPLGGEIGVDAVAVDSSSGSHMPYVYAFCAPRLRRRVVAIKGEPGRRKFIERSKTMKRDPLWLVGVDSIKDSILNRIRTGKVFRFSKALPEVWYEQFTAEQAIVKMERGQPIRRWMKISMSRRNEALDCTVYGIAVKELVQINWQQRREQLASGHILARVVAVESDKPNKPRKAASTWL
jgi:phage terminase large subunit GpA-like protein